MEIFPALPPVWEFSPDLPVLLTILWQTHLPVTPKSHTMWLISKAFHGPQGRGPDNDDNRDDRHHLDADAVAHLRAQVPGAESPDHSESQLSFSSSQAQPSLSSFKRLITALLTYIQGAVKDFRLVLALKEFYSLYLIARYDAVFDIKLEYLFRAVIKILTASRIIRQLFSQWKSDICTYSIINPVQSKSFIQFRLSFNPIVESDSVSSSYKESN